MPGVRLSGRTLDYNRKRTVAGDTQVPSQRARNTHTGKEARWFHTVLGGNWNSAQDEKP